MDAKAYTVTDAHKAAFMPYLASISEKIGTIKPETVKAIFVEASGNSDEFQKKMMEMFAAADANADQLLDADEFVAFEKARAAHQTESFGEALQFTDDEYKAHYEFFNKITPDAQGVS